VTVTAIVMQKQILGKKTEISESVPTTKRKEKGTEGANTHQVSERKKRRPGRRLESGKNSDMKKKKTGTG